MQSRVNDKLRPKSDKGLVGVYITCSSGKSTALLRDCMSQIVRTPSIALGHRNAALIIGYR